MANWRNTQETIHITVKHAIQQSPFPLKVIHMTDANDTQQQNNGGSLLSRTNAQNQAAQNQQNGTQPSNTATSRFASRLSNNNNQQANTAPPAPSPPAPPANPFAANQRRWIIQPVHKIVVRFELRGMGDPFFRLLGYDLNPEYGDFDRLIDTIEQGGEAIEELVAHLNSTWAQLQLKGAAMVYPFNRNTWTNIITPLNAPPANNSDNADDFDLEETKPKPSPYKMVRALDMDLTINVLARARTQLLMSNAPLVLSGQYLGRALITDDPRLVGLVKATGYMEEV